MMGTTASASASLLCDVLQPCVWDDLCLQLGQGCRSPYVHITCSFSKQVAHLQVLHLDCLLHMPPLQQSFGTLVTAYDSTEGL